MISAIDVFRLIPAQSCMMIVNDQGMFSITDHSKGGEASNLEVATFHRNDNLNTDTRVNLGMNKLLISIPSISSFPTFKNKSKG
jgi:hypothetical protein